MQTNHNRVSVFKTDSYDPAAVRAAVDGHFEALSLADGLRPGMKVVVKPNLLMKRTPDEVTTTHPSFVKAVIEKLHSLGIDDITIYDSAGGPFTKVAMSGIMDAAGMTQVAHETGASINADFTHGQKGSADAVVCHNFNISSAILNADCVINLAKLKTHGMTTLSGATKNLFGCIPGLMKPELHFRYPELENFCHMLIDLACLVQPYVTIVDAVDAMEGNGPSGGVRRHTGMSFGSRSTFSLDILLSTFIGVSPEKLRITRNMIERELCPASVDGLELVGDPAAFVPCSDYKLPDNQKSLRFSHSRFTSGLMQSAINLLFAKRPVVRKKNCIGCGKCKESCPMDTIVLENRKARIIRKNCIRCYCCHEMCPVRAIDIK